MKKIVFISICYCIIFPTANAQMHDTTLIPDQYKFDAKSLLLKSKHQKTAAWILLAGGTGLFIAGQSIIFSEDYQELGNDIGAALIGIISLGYVSVNPAPVKRSSIAPVIAYTGLASMLGSIPFFISAHKNKVQAKVFLKNQTLSLIPSENNKQMAVEINIHF